MALENFLENLDKKHQEEKKQKELAEKDLELKKKEQSEFLDIFKNYVTKHLFDELNRLSIKLKSKFDWQQNFGLIESQNTTYALDVILVPTFTTEDKTIEISIQADSNAKKIKFFGHFKNPVWTGAKSSGLLHYFNDSFEKFTSRIIEDEIEQTLNAAFKIE